MSQVTRLWKHRSRPFLRGSLVLALLNLNVSPVRLTLAYRCERKHPAALSHQICGALLEPPQETNTFLTIIRSLSTQHDPALLSLWLQPFSAPPIFWVPWHCPISVPTQILTPRSVTAFNLVVPSTWYPGPSLTSQVLAWLSWSLTIPIPHPVLSSVTFLIYSSLLHAARFIFYYIIFLYCCPLLDQRC